MTELIMEEIKVSEKCNDVQTIREGDYVIVKRGPLMSTCQVVSGKKVWFKKKKFVLDNAVGCKYGSTFKINGVHLECAHHSALFDCDDGENGESEGKDNRGLVDDGKSQKLTREDIETLKEQGLTGEEIVDQLVENSQTFKEKNEYSKKKYLKKKQQKYSSFIIILRPTTRLLIEMYHAQGCLKILGLRMDSLAQMLTLSNVYSGGKFIVVDSCLGLLTGAVLERLAGSGKLVNVYTGCPPQYPVINFYNFSEEQRQCLTWINLDDALNADGDSSVADGSKNVSEKPEEESLREQRRKQRMLNKIEAQNILEQRNMDGILMACKKHPLNILRALIPYMALSRPFVVFCLYQEPLIECYVKLKEDGNILMLNLSETWCRQYQVLPNRTHPTISGSGCSGYLLFGIKAELNTKK